MNRFNMIKKIRKEVMKYQWDSADDEIEALQIAKKIYEMQRAEFAEIIENEIRNPGIWKKNQQEVLEDILEKM